MMKLFVAFALLLLGLSAVPNVVAQDIQQNLLNCYSSSFDAQGDGNRETWNSCSTPTCGCDCPYVGAGVVIEAADHQVGAVAVTSGCQTAYATTNGPADGGAPVTVWPLGGGGVTQG
jgi:hypothetical protein